MNPVMCSRPCKCLEMALKMDCGEETVGPKSSLSEEHAYIDAMHSRVNGYKTVTMWPFHPGMNKVVNLAIMDCQKENTEMLTLFLELFNPALQDLTGNSEYKFNPICVMCDESGANMNAIERVFLERISWQELLHASGTLDNVQSASYLT